MSSRDSRLRSRGVVAGLVLAILTLAAPSLVVAADVTVNRSRAPGGSRPRTTPPAWMP